MKLEDLSEDPTDDEIEAYLEALDTTCQLCGKETYGAAGINDRFYCHPDKGPSCYVQASLLGEPR